MTTVNYKDGYVTVSDFKANRPELAIHSTNAIQSAIYQASAMLNSHTDGKIKAVWDYNNNTENPEETNELYRTANELEYISEAIIQQTQYIINMGNDLTVGSGSYALAGATYSDSTPSSRDTIAPGVNQMLARARVYEYLVMGGSDRNKKIMYANGSAFDPETTFLTYAAAYKIFVSQVQENASVGQVATIQTQNTTKQVVFTDPVDVDLTQYSTTQQMNLAINNAISALNLETYAKLIDLNKLNGIVTQNTTAIANNNSRITALEQKYTNLDLSGYVTQTYVTNNFYSKQEANNLFARKDSFQSPDLSNYITSTDLNNALANYLTNNQAYNLTNTSDTFTINVPTGSANYIELERNGTRKANFGMGSSSSDDFLLQSVGNIKILPGSGKNINVSGYRITNAGTPTSSSDVATKQYVDNAVAAGGGSGGGGTTPDLSNYVTTTQLNDALTNYVSNSNLTTQLANYLTTTNANNNYVSKTQPITLGAARDKPVKISGGTKNPVFVEFVRNNTNMGYIGLGSGNNNNINIGARSGNLCLEVPSGNSVMVNNSTIQGVADPVNATDAANKQYVDNAIANVPNNNPDLSNYVTQTGLNNALNNYALKTSLSSYVTTNTLNNTLSSYAKTSSVNQANSQAQTALTNANNALNQVTSKQDKIGSTVSNYVLYTQSFYNNVAIGSSYTAFFTVTCTLPNSSYKPINVSLWVNNSTSSTSRAFKIIQWRPVANQVNIRIERSTSNATLGVKELYIRVVGANANMFNYWDVTDGSTTTPSPISLARTNDVVEEDEKVIKLVPVEGTY